MDDDDTANSGVDEGATVEDTEVTQGAEPTEEQQFDDDGNPIEDQADIEEDEEIDLDEETKLKLPKSQAEKLRQAMLRQADYTKKTQALADERKALEAEREVISKSSAQELEARANLALIDRQIQQFAQVDWNKWHDSDPFEAQKAFSQYQLLKDAKTQTTQYLGQAQQERTLKEQQETAKRLEEGAAELARDIKEWSDPTYPAKLTDFATKRFGFAREDLDSIDDPRLVKVLHAAFQWEQHQTKAKKAQSLQKQAEVTPAARTTVGSNPIPPGKLDERLSVDEWQRRREAQLRKRA